MIFFWGGKIGSMTIYKKPILKSYSAKEIIEEIGPCQSQYTTTLYTTTGNSSVNVDGLIEFTNPVYSVYSSIALSVGEGPAAGSYDRSFVGFDISSLTGRTIVSATLRIYQDLASDPYGDSKLGNVLVDHVNFGTSLDSADFGAAALTSNIGAISTNSTLEWKTLDVTTYVQNDLNSGRTSSQFRLRFTNTSNGPPQNQAIFESAENYRSTNNKPELVVIYQ